MRSLCHLIWSAVLLSGLISPIWAALPFRGKHIRDETQLLKSYDYVVIGGGIAGLVVGNRLSEDLETSVLIIEAGILDHEEPFIEIPALAGDAVGTIYDWNLTYVTNPDTNNRSISIPLGKAVGGGSLLNRMVFDRGSVADYDRWETLGNPGWGWDGLLPYFRKSEIFTPPDSEIEAEWGITFDESVHGEDGYLQSSYSPFIWPATRQFIDAVTELDVVTSEDGASGQSVGGYFSTHAQNPSNATRSTARTAYYNPFVSRPSLHLLTSRQVTRVIIKSTYYGGSPQVTGVEFAESSTAPRATVNVNKEAILAAGSIHSPQVLQLSGIGDSALLAQHNISTVANVPGVGRNLQDHPLLYVTYQFDFPLTVQNLTTNATFAAESLKQYYSEHDGPYSSATGDYLVFLPVRNFTNQTASIYQEALEQDPTAYLETDTPASVVAGYVAQHKLLVDGVNAEDQAVAEFIWDEGSIVLGLEHPFSRGSVRLASADPFDAPLADSAFLRNPLDVTLLIEAVKFTREIVGTSAFKPFNPVDVDPPSNVTTDADIEDFIRESVDTFFHPVGTCKAGPFDEGGVVDNEFRVYGIDGLRVVDASVFPILPSTHTQASVYAVAEMAADAIKQSARQPGKRD